jgi:hypothetical protein
VKSLALTLSLVVALGVVAAGFVWGAGFDDGTRLSALVGVLAGTVMGLVSLLVKTQLAGRISQGIAGLKALLAAQGVSFFLRLLALAAGLLGLRGEPSTSPMAFVIAFFAVSLGQQALEMKSLLAARNPVTS